MRIPVIGAVLLVILTLLADFYIFSDICRFASAKRKRVYKWIFWITTAICWCALAAILLFPIRNADDSILPLMWLLFSYLSVYFAKFIYCICSLIGRLFCIGKKRKKKFNYGIYAGECLGALLIIILWVGVGYTRHQIEVNDVEIYSARLPEAFDGMRVLQFSDAHVGTWGRDTTFVSQLVDSINAQKADIVLFTGDIVNRRSSELDPFVKVFSRIKAPHGVYAVLGNHDYAGYVDWPNPEDANKDVARLVGLMKSMGWTVYGNQSGFVKQGNDSIAIIGVENWGEPPFGQRGNLMASYAAKGDTVHSLYDDTFKILLTHNPEHWGRYVKDHSNIDLSLAGHTHAMQMMLKVGNWKWSPSKYKYERWGGLYTEKSKDGTPINLYVNIGSGEVGFPARIGAAKPELTLFTLRREEGK